MFVVQNDKPKIDKISKGMIDKKLKSDFSALYETKRGSDVILVAGDQKFSAHKAILMARSDVFAAMFDNQMRESIENIVEIKDIEPEVLEVMLFYIYSGDVRDLEKIGTSLMTAANMYGLDQLKTVCSHHLATNISPNTAIETLILSKLLNDSNLERSALEFIRDNSKDVIKTKEWFNLMTESPELVNEIFVFSTNNQSIEGKIRWDLTEFTNFSVLYETRRGSDVILVAGNQEFNAHKAILMARSNVFAAMFDNQMRESIENIVEIKDIEPQVLEVMLLYIYTGDVKDWRLYKIGAPLMTAADKYGLDQLKTICSRYIIINICPNTAIKTLVLSKFMNDSNLKKSALEFIRDNITDVIQTKEWFNLMTESTQLLNEIVLFSTNNHSIEAKISWNLTEMSKFKTLPTYSQIESASTKIHGLPWRIRAKPRRIKLKKGRSTIKHLEVFLYCDKKVPRKLSYNVRGNIRIVSQNGRKRYITGKIFETYFKDRMIYGNSTFTNWNKLMDPNAGYIKDDSIILEANIIVDPPKGNP